MTHMITGNVHGADWLRRDQPAGQQERLNFRVIEMVMNQLEADGEQSQWVKRDRRGDPSRTRIVWRDTAGTNHWSHLYVPSDQVLGWDNPSTCTTHAVYCEHTQSYAYVTIKVTGRKTVRIPGSNLGSWWIQGTKVRVTFNAGTVDQVDAEGWIETEEGTYSEGETTLDAMVEDDRQWAGSWDNRRRQALGRLTYRSRATRKRMGEVKDKRGNPA